MSHNVITTEHQELLSQILVGYCYTISDLGATELSTGCVHKVTILSLTSHKHGCDKCCELSESSSLYFTWLKQRVRIMLPEVVIHVFRVISSNNSIEGK